ncbi:MAG: cytochrome c-type biogenesis protein CcmH [Beijerinckiaceae bacterium]|jgi:cytochrome c-type biogenesis protein CcmH|nr:cytochrome c-type biogenesis protein CcmH [Beijerinckiaceae bacterium]
MMGKLFSIIFLLLFVPLAHAVQPNEILQDKGLETRARDISAGLRCLVCQNQSIDDSDAPLARDLRILVRERLKAGDSDADVLNFVVARYGNFILLKPPFNFQTVLLWLLPAIVLLLAGGMVVWNVRRSRSALTRAVPLNDKEIAKLRDILDEK